ncbi:hypothetical protein ACFXJO_05700 [Streptomyces lavendulae]|uniref:hypothetical protein n=1 Tax=Streptomyces lavendulae TaxID=1914 RepID=UPI0036817C47
MSAVPLTEEQRDLVLRQVARFTSLAAQLLAGLAPAAEAAPQLRAIHDTLRAAGLGDPLPSEPCDCGHPIDGHQWGECTHYECYCDRIPA